MNPHLPLQLASPLSSSRHTHKEKGYGGAGAANQNTTPPQADTATSARSKDLDVQEPAQCWAHALIHVWIYLESWGAGRGAQTRILFRLLDVKPES